MQRKSENISINFNAIPKKFVNRLLIYVVFPVYAYIIFIKILLFQSKSLLFWRLIEIVTISSKCLLAFSPSLLELLTHPEFIPTKWQPLVEIQFNAPKLSVGSTILSFGTILNAAIIFTKALNIVSGTKNILPEKQMLIQSFFFNSNNSSEARALWIISMK